MNVTFGSGCIFTPGSFLAWAARTPGVRESPESEVPGSELRGIFLAELQ